jgi:hypothetical protein
MAYWEKEILQPYHLIASPGNESRAMGKSSV